jgi:hypothetical protein
MSKISGEKEDRDSLIFCLKMLSKIVASSAQNHNSIHFFVEGLVKISKFVSHLSEENKGYYYKYVKQLVMIIKSQQKNKLYEQMGDTEMKSVDSDQEVLYKMPNGGFAVRQPKASYDSQISLANLRLILTVDVI